MTARLTLTKAVPRPDLLTNSCTTTLPISFVSRAIMSLSTDTVPFALTVMSCCA